MRKLTITLTILLFFAIKTSAQPQKYYDLIQQAVSRYNANHFDSATMFYKQAFALQFPSNYRTFVSAAASAARAGNRDLAFQWLDNAYQNGLPRPDNLLKSSDFTDLHTDSRWAEMSARLQQRANESSQHWDTALHRKLLAINANDQEIRNEFEKAAEKAGGDPNNPILDSLKNVMAAHDSADRIEIAPILDSRGWPGINEVGPDACQVPFLVIQHSTDLSFMEKYLPMVLRAVKKGIISAGNLAYLEDRIELRHARPQIYGTQANWDEKLNKSYISPMIDPDNVDHRRARLGLESMSDYANRLRVTWDLVSYKKTLPDYQKRLTPW